MDEEEEGLFSSCFRDLKVNAELARAVARELQVWISSCADARSVLRGLTRYFPNPRLLALLVVQEYKY